MNFDAYVKVIEHIHDGVYFVDKNRDIVFWNKAAEEITGFTAEEVVGHNCADNILDHVDEDMNHICVLGCPLDATIHDGIMRDEVLYLHHKDGHRIKIHTKILPIYNGDTIEGAFEIFTDNKHSVNSSMYIKELTKASYNDYLTGIPNRQYMEKQLDSCLRDYKVLGINFAVLFIDIDNFKSFNDNYGHDVGDMALKAVTKSATNLLGKKDFLSRWGGDEFVMSLVEIDKQQLEKTGQRLAKLIDASAMTINGEYVPITASIGATIVKPDDTIDSIIKRADMLMYKSKLSGKNRVTVG